VCWYDCPSCIIANTYLGKSMSVLKVPKEWVKVEEILWKFVMMNSKKVSFTLEVLQLCFQFILTNVIQPNMTALGQHQGVHLLRQSHICIVMSSSKSLVSRKNAVFRTCLRSIQMAESSGQTPQPCTNWYLPAY
jgi:hypothetical protein